MLGGLVPWLGVGRHWVGVGLPLGLLGGATLFVVWQGLKTDGRRGSLSENELLVIALLAAIAGHVVETLVGIAIVATHTLFWVYVAIIVRLAADAQAHRSKTDDPDVTPPLSPSPPPPSSPSPRLPSTAWGLITGVMLALFGFPILEAGGARGWMVWGVVSSAVLLFGLLRLLLREGGEWSEEDLLRYVGLTVGAVVALSLLAALPWPPVDITHPTVAVFVYVGLAVLGLALVMTGLPHRGALTPTHWGRRSIYGVLGVGTLAVIWFTNINPIRADVFYKEGLGLSSAGNLHRAIGALEKSVALSPGEDRYRSGAGAAYAQMAQAAQEPDQREAWLSTAEGYLQEARRLDPYRADHVRNLGVLYRMWAQLSAPSEQTSYLRQALRYYQQAAERNPVSVRIWREWGEIYAMLGEWGAAIERYERSLHLNGGFVDTWLLLAEARLRQTDYAGARQAYDQALTLGQERVLQSQRAAVQHSPDDPFLHQALALVYAALGQPEAAMAEADAARGLMGEEPASWGQFLEALE
ncbi:MAG: hypothetical protein MAG451_01679 [Anaerolineales bacterium]|nr:hypothetical protein [Anaerolineales bacterium]